MYMSNYQLKVLKFLSHKTVVPYAKLSCKFRFRNKNQLDDALKSLRHQNLIDFVLPSCGTDSDLKSVFYDDPIEDLRFVLTFEGRSFIEDRCRNNRLFWIPYGITTFVAIISAWDEIPRFIHGILWLFSKIFSLFQVLWQNFH